jgi:hypothetical protein
MFFFTDWLYRVVRAVSFRKGGLYLRTVPVVLQSRRIGLGIDEDVAVGSDDGDPAPQGLAEFLQDGAPFRESLRSRARSDASRRPSSSRAA